MKVPLSGDAQQVGQELKLDTELSYIWRSRYGSQSCNDIKNRTRGWSYRYDMVVSELNLILNIVKKLQLNGSLIRPVYTGVNPYGFVPKLERIGLAYTRDLIYLILFGPAIRTRLDRIE